MKSTLKIELPPVWLFLIRCCANSPLMLLLLISFFYIIICVGESFCCHCQSLTGDTMDPDRWKKLINSRPILEFEVLPSWPRAGLILGICLLPWKLQPEPEDERIHTTEQETCFSFCSAWIASACLSKLWETKMCDVKMSCFVFFFPYIFQMLPGAKWFPVGETIHLVLGYSLKTISHVQTHKHPGTCSFVPCNNKEGSPLFCCVKRGRTSQNVLLMY